MRPHAQDNKKMIFLVVAGIIPLVLAPEDAPSSFPEVE